MSDDRDALAADVLGGKGRWLNTDGLIGGALFAVMLIGCISFMPEEGTRTIPSPWIGASLAVGALFITSLLPLVWLGERGIVRSRALARLLALVAPGLARGLEEHLPFEGLLDVTPEPRRGEETTGRVVLRYATRQVLMHVPGIDWQRFLRLAQEKLEAWRLKHPPLPPPPPRVQVDARAPAACCPYCKDAVADDVARACAACRTVHHAECFEAHAGCSTLGCAEGPPRAERAPPQQG